MSMLILDISRADGGLSEQLLQLLEGREYTVLQAADGLSGGFSDRMSDRAGCDGLLITGDYTACPPRADGAVPGSDDQEALIELLRTTGWPVLAVGFGFELLCEACGIDLSSYGQRGVGAEKIEPTTEGGKLFQGSDPLCVAAAERWLTDGFPKSLQVLARSRTGVEAVRHKTRPLYGLQQRPEDFLYLSDARMVYKNIFSIFDQYNARH